MHTSWPRNRPRPRARYCGQTGSIAKSAEVGFFSLNPQYNWKDAKHRIIGYQVTTSVSVKLKDFSKIGPVTQQLADASVGESQSLSYTLESIDEAKGKAVADAYRRARASAQALANASGRTLGELSYASVDTFENIRPMARCVPQSDGLDGRAYACSH